MGMEGFRPGKRIEDKDKARAMAEAGDAERSKAAENREIARGEGKLDNPEHDATVTKALEKEAVRLDARADESEEKAGESYEKYKDV